MDASQSAALEALLAATADGDRAAFAALYRHASPQLLTLAVRILRRREMAEEVLQEAFISIWRHADDFRPEKGSPMAWMATIVRNRALDRRRRARPEVALDEDASASQWADPAPDPLAQALISDEARRLGHCLDELEDGPRRAITLAYYDGYTHEELVARLDAPLGTIKSWIRRGLLRLKGCLGS